MSFLTWFSNRHSQAKTSPRLRLLVDKVIDYIRAHPETNELFPQIVARAVGETELAVLAALGELDDAGVVHPQYGTYCKTHGHPLNVYPKLENVPLEEECERCDRPVSVSDETMDVELYFTVDRAALNEFKRSAA